MVTARDTGTRRKAPRIFWIRPFWRERPAGGSFRDLSGRESLIRAIRFFLRHVGTMVSYINGVFWRPRSVGFGKI